MVGEVQPPVEEKGERVVHSHNLCDLSRKVNAEEFQRLALVEIHRRGVEHAQEVAAIMDGAEWEQGFTDYHCPQAKRILDFPMLPSISTRLESFYMASTPLKVGLAE